MAVSLVNPRMNVSEAQLEILQAARSRPGFHVYYQGDGEPTLKEYAFKLPNALLEFSPSIVVAIRIADGYKSFKFRLGSIYTDQHIVYTHPGKEGSTEPLAWRKWNDQDNPIETKTSKHRVRPGIRVLRIACDDQYRVQFYTDSNPLMKDLMDIIMGLNQVIIKSDGGRVFETHYTADDPLGIFVKDFMVVTSTPKLAPGAYVEITGTMSESAKALFVLSEKGEPDHNPEAIYHANLPNAGAEPITWVVKFYESYLLVDTGKENKMIKHNFKTPARFSIKDFQTTNIEMVTSSDL
ncbi:uncharacterized protein LOC144106865 [Amblyomma americanum]